jgi:hypothetical protein
MRLKLIACEVFYREICAEAARSIHQVDLLFMPKGLHDQGPAAMRKRLQQAVDEASAGPYEAVLLGYGLCGNGIAGLQARTCPLIVPRAHDCITLFLGSRERYQNYFENHPGVYFLTSGWIERGRNLEPQLSLNYADLAARYGEDNARYLQQELTRHYRQITFIQMGVEPDRRFEEHAQREAAGRGWAFEKVEGDLALIRQLVNGPWDDAKFLTVPPGWRVTASHDDGVLRAEKA